MSIDVSGTVPDARREPAVEPEVDEAFEQLIQQHLARSQKRTAAQRRAKWFNHLATGVMVALVGLLVVVLAFIVGFILTQGVPQFSWTFITTSSSLTQAGGGVGPQLWCTMYLMVLSLLMTVPIGVGLLFICRNSRHPAASRMPSA